MATATIIITALAGISVGLNIGALIHFSADREDQRQLSQLASEVRSLRSQLDRLDAFYLHVLELFALNGVADDTQHPEPPAHKENHCVFL